MKKIVLISLLLLAAFTAQPQIIARLTADTAGTIAGCTAGRTHYFTSPKITNGYNFSIEIYVTPSGTHATDSTKVVIEASSDGSTYFTLTDLGTPFKIGTAAYYASTTTATRLSGAGHDAVGWTWTPGYILTHRYVRAKITQYKTGSILTVNRANLHLYKVTVANPFTASSVLPTYYVDTVNAQRVRGVKTFYSPLKFAVGTQSIVLGYLTGATSISDVVLAGNQAGRYATNLSNSVGIGSNSILNGVDYSTEITALGHQSALKGGERSVAIGANAGTGARLYWSTLVGNNAGNFGNGVLDVEGAIRIGNRAGGSDTTDNTIYIHSCDQTVTTAPDSTHAAIYAKTDAAGNANRIRINGRLVTRAVEATSLAATTVTTTGVLSGVGVKVATTDTVTAAAVGTMCYKVSDSTLYLKIRMTGTTGARWKKLN